MVAFGAAQIPHSAYAVVGPRVVPFAVAALRGGLGLLLLAHALAGQLVPEESFAGEPPGRRALGWVAGGLVLNVALIRPLGFMLAATLLFVCVARGFGTTWPARDAGIRLVLGLAVFLAFNRLLGVRFGGGLVEDLVGLVP